MHAMPAQISAESIGSWLQVAFWLFGGTAAIVGAVVGLKKLSEKPQAGTPQPFVVQGSVRFATMEEHEKLEARVDGIGELIRSGFERLDHKRSQSVAGLHDDLEGSITDLRKEVKEDITGVHNRINDIAQAIARIEGKLESPLTR